MTSQNYYWNSQSTKYVMRISHSGTPYLMNVELMLNFRMHQPWNCYEKGLGTVMSDSICFPAKIVHGHIYNPLEKKIDRIFYPMVILNKMNFAEPIIPLTVRL